MFASFVSAAKHKENLLIERIEEIRHHIRIESAVHEGSQNMLKHLKVLKSIDKKALQEVRLCTACTVQQHPFYGHCRSDCVSWY